MRPINEQQEFISTVISTDFKTFQKLAITLNTVAVSICFGFILSVISSYLGNDCVISFKSQQLILISFKFLLLYAFFAAIPVMLDGAVGLLYLLVYAIISLEKKFGRKLSIFEGRIPNDPESLKKGYRIVVSLVSFIFFSICTFSVAWGFEESFSRDRILPVQQSAISWCTENGWKSFHDTSS